MAQQTSRCRPVHGERTSSTRVKTATNAQLSVLFLNVQMRLQIAEHRDASGLAGGGLRDFHLPVRGPADLPELDGEGEQPADKI